MSTLASGLLEVQGFVKISDPGEDTSQVQMMIPTSIIGAPLIASLIYRNTPAFAAGPRFVSLQPEHMRQPALLQVPKVPSPKTGKSSKGKIKGSKYSKGSKKPYDKK